MGGQTYSLLIRSVIIRICQLKKSSLIEHLIEPVGFNASIMNTIAVSLWLFDTLPSPLRRRCVHKRPKTSMTVYLYNRRKELARGSFVSLHQNAFIRTWTKNQMKYRTFRCGFFCEKKSFSEVIIIIVRMHTTVHSKLDSWTFAGFEFIISTLNIYVYSSR